VQFAYATAGNKQAKLTVRDADGASGTDIVRITVQ
jgi:hypothetical protein